jgi:tetratricopeptide (TPR) repeat protein
MKKHIVVGMLIVSALSLALMGFQCSSAEITSAKLYIQRKDFSNAETQLMKEVSKNPKNEEAWFLLGQVRFEMKDYKGMKDAFVKASEAGIKFKKEIAQQTVAVWARLFNDGVEKINKAEDPAGFDAAIEAFNMAIYVLPDSVVNYQNLGLAIYRKGDLEGAIAPLTLAFEKANSVYAIRILNSIYMSRATDHKAKFIEENRDIIEEAKNVDQVREKIKAADVKYYIGKPSSVKQETKGKGKRAVVVKEIWTFDKYNMTVTVEGEFVSKVDFAKPFVPAIDSTNYFLAKKEFEKAIAILKRGTAAFPEDAEFSENLMNAYIGADLNDEARVLLNDRVKRYPDSKYDRYNLGVFLLKDNKFEESINEFKAVLEIDPEFSSAVYNLAATYVNWGVAEQERLKQEGKDDDKSYQEKYRLAIPYLEKVVTEKPNDIQIWELLGQVYANLGMAEKAKNAYDRSDAIRQEKN